MYIYIWIVLVCRMDFHRIWLICTYYVHSNSTTLRRPPWIRRSKLSSCGMDSTSSAQPRIPMEWIMFNGKILENRGKSWDILGNHGKIVENHWNINGTSIKINGQSITIHGNSWKIMIITSWIIHCKAMENNWNVNDSQQATPLLKMKQPESEHGNFNKNV